jgi:hypothetical protein
MTKGDTLYFWWTIVAVFGAAALALYASMAFAMGGNERLIQIGFALCVAKLLVVIAGAMKASSGRRTYIASILIASAVLPCFYLGQILYSKSSPFSYQWNFGDGLLAMLVAIDLVEIFLASSRLFQLRTSR